MFTSFRGMSGVSLLLAVAAVLTLLSIAAPASAEVYNVGPGQALANVRDVPWESLAAGDTVNIYCRPEPYKEKFNITAAGTAAKPVLIHGVPDSSGRLPVIDGKDAVTRTKQTYPSDERAVVHIGRDNNHGAGFQTSYVTIENIEIVNGKAPNKYTSDDGDVKSYRTGTEGLYVCMADHVTLRNLVIHDNGEGYFFSSSDQYGTTSAMWVEGCYVYNNGVVGSDQVHGSYCESLGVTYQYNHYGPLLPGCSGADLKDRSAGTVIRYNWLEDGAWNIDLVDAEGSAKIANDPTYGSAFVYGNVMIKGDKAPNYKMLHFGGDGADKVDTSRYRSRPLQCYNNTFVSRSTTETARVFQGSRGNTGAMIAYNNIFYAASGSMYICYKNGTVNLSHNWITKGFMQADGTCTINDDGTQLTGTEPGFLDYAGQDYHLAAGSPCKDAGQALPAVDLPDNNVAMEYAMHQSVQPRPGDGHLDVGAYEYNGGKAVSVMSTGTGK